MDSILPKTTKEQRRAAKLADRKAQKKMLKAQRSHPLLRGTTSPFLGGIKIVGRPYPYEVPLKLFFGQGNDDAAAAAGGGGGGGGGASASARDEDFPRPEGVAVQVGWSNMSTHAFLTEACLIDPATNQPWRGVEIVGPPFPVESHMGAMQSPGTVRVKVLSPEMKELGLPPMPLDFIVLEGIAGVKEGNMGNDHLQLLKVIDIHRYRTAPQPQPALAALRGVAEGKEEDG